MTAGRNANPMIVLTNNLTDRPDEGNLKVTSSLIKRLKAFYPQTEIVTYQNRHQLGDCHMNVTNLMLSADLMKHIRRKKESVLYCAAPARMLFAAIRTFVVSFYARGRVAVILTMYISEISAIPKGLMKLSRAKIIVLCKDMCREYRRQFKNDVFYVKAGIDTKKYTTVDLAAKKMLRRKYGVPEDKPVVLHVGHLQEGRNIRTLLSLDESIHVVLVTSTYEYDRRDMLLREALTKRRNITLIEDYVADIQEIYQMSDVYFFPVMNEKNCISVPLSVLEAAACNLPVVCTEFGELKQFKGNDGFFFIDSFEPENINHLVKNALQSKADTRSCVLEYDWEQATRSIMQIIQ